MKTLTLLLIIIMAAGCREKYVSPATSPVTGYLVVEGYINPAGTTSIQLTRTTKLSDINTAYERRATVSIQNQLGQNFPLAETSNGVYTATLNLVTNTNYRLRIVTTAGKTYQSEYTSPKSTPPIDSISWQRNSDGVQLSVHAKGTPNHEKYYHWKAEETFEYHADYYSKFKFQFDPTGRSVIDIRYYDPVNHFEDTTVFRCWRTDNSSTILLGNVENLSDNILHYPLFLIPDGSIKLNILYSVNIKQYNISKEAYQFLAKVKKNTEQLGTIFDAQPSELKGNITCITTPDEPVIGFIEISQEQQKRIFISITQLPGWKYQSGCETAKVDMKGAGTLSGVDTSSLPVDGAPGSYAIIAKNVCVDCTKRGGVNKKPLFWP